MKQRFLFLFVLFFAQNSLAYDGRWWLLLGTEFGYQNVSGVTAPEVTKDGAEFGAKLVIAKYLRHWAFDAGAGYRVDNLVGSNGDVTTKTWLMEASFRYRINDRLHIGPVLTFLIGQDNSFSDIGTNSNDEPVSVFLGLKGMYDIPLGKKGDLLLRVGGQVITDLDIANRQVTALQGLLEFGIPLGGKTIKDVKEAAPEITVNLKDMGVRFETAKAKLLEPSVNPLRKLARALAKHSGQFDKVFIGGHTDKRGDYAKNVRLSKARAESVAKLLEEEGVSRDRLLIAGYGPDQPLEDVDTETAHQKNRRVELKILGATNRRSQDLVRAIRQIRSDSRDPQGLIHQ